MYVCVCVGGGGGGRDAGDVGWIQNRRKKVS